MDGGQVALSADGKLQFSAWMNSESGKRRLFFARVKPGEEPEGSALVDFDGQQGHPVVTPLSDGRAFVAFEANETIGAVVLDADGKVEKKQLLGKAGKFPRLVQTKDAIVVTWESTEGVQTCTVAAAWWKPGD